VFYLTEKHLTNPAGSRGLVDGSVRCGRVWFAGYGHL
jgi:hypothetical protein